MSAAASGESPLQPTVDRLRTAARWLLGAVGAIGVALAIGAQFSNLGKLEGRNRDLALLGVGLAFAGIGLAIGASVRVLLPRTRHLKELADREDQERVKRPLRSDPALELFRQAPELVRPFRSVREVFTEREHYLDLYSEAYKKWSESPTEPQARALRNAKVLSKEVEAAATDVINWAGYATIRRVYLDSRVAVLLGVIAAAAGVTLFALKIPDVPPDPPTPAAVALTGLKEPGSAQFKGKSLQGADLSKSDFSDADLTKTDLSDAKLSDANLQGANLSQANLEGATGLTAAAVAKATWSSTTCPDGRSSDDVGDTCEAHLNPAE